MIFHPFYFPTPPTKYIREKTNFFLSFYFSTLPPIFYSLTFSLLQSNKPKTLDLHYAQIYFMSLKDTFDLHYAPL